MAQVDFVAATVSDWRRLRPGLDPLLLTIVQQLLWCGRLAEDILDRNAASSGFRKRGDYEVLAVVRRADPDALTPAEVAHLLRASPSGMTGKVDRLERQGLLTREADAYDRRIVNLVLSDMGRDLIDEAFDTSMELYEEMLATLTRRQKEALSSLLQNLLERLDSLVSSSRHGAKKSERSSPSL